MVSPDATEIYEASRSIGFNMLFYESVDEALSVLGSAGEIIHFYLENVYHLKSEELAEKPEVVSFTLKKILGSGSRFIEHRILRNLFSKIGLKYEVSNIEKPPLFIELIKKAKIECSKNLSP